MMDNLHLNFLREKITDLKTALLYSNSESVLRLPTTIVTSINVDELGQIWLLVPRPPQNIQEFERNFPVKLNFYRKGKDFYLNVSGKGTIVLEPGELDEVADNVSVDSMNPDQWILLKVAVDAVEFHDHSMAEKHSWISAISAHVNRWISQDPGSYKPMAIH